MSDSIDVILPCLNEAEALPAVLGALPEGYRALVVDNGSTDATAEVAKQLGASVVTEPHRGYGAAVQAGVWHASSEVVAVLDADGSIPAAILPVLAGEVLAGRADLAVGRRRPVAGSQPWHTRWGNAVLTWWVRRRGLPVHDIAPVRVTNRKALLALGVTDRAFGYPLELLVRAAAAGWTVAEVDVAYRQRLGGESKVSGSWRGTLRATRGMAGVVVRTWTHR
ncbi:glycosyltransferase family 2 protein [Amycolatopsis sp. OK19-0408]|uniref:Glycosyltransferase family 2 protein n=1 Tax=Amycolatopsis iheyensis TaxID=2945988 RepID=A0A9X2SR24_9PSEU|nr:glycosyltransferase family 2 protein [Amycolatopsis iheyensis]MCR6490553.1 glycosyltransferase family 2 protein [Amycolatopsis iheyensis]